MQNRYSPSASFAVSAKNSVKNKNCQLCRGEHFVLNCSKYPDAKSRSGKARDLKLCFNCLYSNHMVSNCMNKGNCKLCNRRHHTALCEAKDKFPTRTIKLY